MPEGLPHAWHIVISGVTHRLLPDADSGQAWQSGLPRLGMRSSDTLSRQRLLQQAAGLAGSFALRCSFSFSPVLQASALQKAPGLIGPGKVGTRTEGTWNLNFRRIALRSKTCLLSASGAGEKRRTLKWAGERGLKRRGLFRA